MHIVQTPEANDRNRAAALHAMHTLGAPAMETHVRTALESDVPRLRAAATSILARLSPQQAIPILTSHLHDHSTPEHQSALSTLARMQNRESDNLLLDQLKLMASGDLPAAVELELMAAVQKRARDGVSRFAKWRDTSNDSEDPRISHRECLEGGDAKRGWQIFEKNTAVSCKRCHALKKERGDLAGPALMDVGRRLSRGDLLSSIVKPNREITEGFGSVNLFTKDDNMFTGRIASETADSVTIITDDGEKTTRRVIARDNVDLIKKALSAMPTDIASKLTRRDIRDLVEFLWQQKGK
jgi:quinoprotein glucose dehydrogenase